MMGSSLRITGGCFEKLYHAVIDAEIGEPNFLACHEYGCWKGFYELA